MSERYEICTNCKNDECDMCEDTWSGASGDDHYCICDCNRIDSDDFLDNTHDDIWNRYKDIYEDGDDEDYN